MYFTSPTIKWRWISLRQSCVIRQPQKRLRSRLGVLTLNPTPGDSREIGRSLSFGSVSDGQRHPDQHELQRSHRQQVSLISCPSWGSAQSTESSAAATNTSRVFRSWRGEMKIQYRADLGTAWYGRHGIKWLDSFILTAEKRLSWPGMDCSCPKAVEERVEHRKGVVACSYGRRIRLSWPRRSCSW